MKTVCELKQMVYDAYTKEGFDEGVRIGEFLGFRMEYCKTCDCQIPSYEGSCLICREVVPLKIFRPITRTEMDPINPLFRVESHISTIGKRSLCLGKHEAIFVFADLRDFLEKCGVDLSSAINCD